jgi:hypothetical protein
MSVHVSYDCVDSCPETVSRTVARKRRYIVEYGGAFYPAVSIAHVCEILDFLGLDYDGNLLWILHRHRKRKSEAAKSFLAFNRMLKLHEV